MLSQQAQPTVELLYSLVNAMNDSDWKQYSPDKELVLLIDQAIWYLSIKKEYIIKNSDSGKYEIHPAFIAPKVVSESQAIAESISPVAQQLTPADIPSPIKRVVDAKINDVKKADGEMDRKKEDVPDSSSAPAGSLLANSNIYSFFAKDDTASVTVNADDNASDDIYDKKSIMPFPGEPAQQEDFLDAYFQQAHQEAEHKNADSNNLAGAVDAGSFLVPRHSLMFQPTKAGFAPSDPLQEQSAERKRVML